MRPRSLPPNCGPLDRLLRGVAGILLLGLYGALDAPLRYLTFLGFPLLATALTGFCPLYALLGLSTGRRKGTSP
jgi:hypothetical protein